MDFFRRRFQGGEHPADIPLEGQEAGDTYDGLPNPNLGDQPPSSSNLEDRAATGGADLGDPRSSPAQAQGNVWWSEKANRELLLKHMRPSNLPVSGDEPPYETADRLPRSGPEHFDLAAGDSSGASGGYSENMLLLGLPDGKETPVSSEASRAGPGPLQADLGRSSADGRHSGSEGRALEPDRKAIDDLVRLQQLLERSRAPEMGWQPPGLNSGAQVSAAATLPATELIHLAQHGNQAADPFMMAILQRLERAERRMQRHRSNRTHYPLLTLIQCPSPQEPSKLVQNLPLLEVIEGSAEASVTTGDWMARIGPLMRSLSPGAPGWWSQVVSTATEYYQQWLKSDSLQRLAIKSDVVAQGATLEYGHLRRVEERGSVLVLQAFPPTLQSEAVSVRALGTVSLLFLAMTKYQPGGTGEKSAILSFLTQPQLEGGNGVQSNHAALRKWERLYRRCVELGLAPPDPTLLVRALDGLGKTIGNKSPHIAFRLATFRHQYQLDAIPNETSVLQYCQLLLAEAEAWMIAASAGGEPAKHPRVATMNQDPATAHDSPAKPPAGKAKGGNKGGRNKGEGGPLTAEGSCKFFMSDAGCRYGKPCIHPHPSLAPADGKCFNCGSVEHGAAECTRPKGAIPAAKGDSKGHNTGKSKAGSPQVDPKANTPSPKKPPKAKKVEISPDANEGGADAQLNSLCTPNLQLEPEAICLTASLKGISEDKPRGLVDGGASHNLRFAGPHEYKSARAVTVKLASGKAYDLRMNTVGTLLSPNPNVQPIVAMGLCTRLLGCKVAWEDNECNIHHPLEGPIEVTMVDDCPEVSHTTCLSLIQQIEEQRSKLMLKALRNDCPDPADWLRMPKDEFLEHLEDWALDLWGLPSSNAPLIPTEGYGSQDTGLNRHRRRRINRGKVVLCFAPGNPKWNFKGSQEILRVDNRPGQGLENQALYQYLLLWAREGLIEGVVGELPEGDLAFRRCIVLTEVALQGVWHGSAKTKQALVILKSPEQSKQCQDVGAQKVSARWSLKLVSFDLGALDGLSVGPTHVLTNSGHLWEALEEVRIPRNAPWIPSEHSDGEPARRVWPTSLCTVVHQAMAEWQQGLKHREDKDRLRVSRLQHLLALGWEPGEMDDACILRSLKPRSKEMFRKHCLAGHRPWRADCAACVDSMAHIRPHRRLKMSRVCGLNIDVSGPHRTADSEDQDVARPRYFLVGNYSFPMFQYPADAKPESESIPVEAPIPDEWVDEPEENPLPEPGECEGAGVWEEAEEPDRRGVDWIDEARVKGENKKWDTVIAGCKEPSYKVLNIPLLEILPTKSPQAIVSALNRFYAKLRSWGLPVFRLHSDHAQALTHKSVSDWAAHRGIYKTTAMPEQPAGIGKAEQLVKAIKAQVRALLISSGAPPALWPHAARYACASLQRRALLKVGHDSKPLVPFYAVVKFRSRTWRDTKWGSKATQGRLVAPSTDISKGYIVRVDDNGVNRLYATTLVYRDFQEEPEPPTIEGPDEPAPVVLPSGAVVGRPAPEGAAEIQVPPEVANPIAEAPKVLPDGSLDVEADDTCHVHLLQSNAPTVGELGVVVEDLRGEALEASTRSLMGYAMRYHVVSDDDLDNLAGQIGIQPMNYRCRSNIAALLKEWCSRSEGIRASSTGCSRTVGVYHYGGVVGLTRDHESFPGITALLANLVKQLTPGVCFSAVSVSWQARHVPHRDMHNAKNTPNILIPLMLPKQGGRLWLSVAPGDIVVGPIQMCTLPDGQEQAGQVLGLKPWVPTVFDAKRWHATTSYQSEEPRLVVVAYMPVLAARLTTPQRDALRAVGFPCDDASVCVDEGLRACQQGESTLDSLDADSALAGCSSAVNVTGATLPSLAACAGVRPWWCPPVPEPETQEYPAEPSPRYNSSLAPNGLGPSTLYQPPASVCVQPEPAKAGDVAPMPSDSDVRLRAARGSGLVWGQEEKHGPRWYHALPLPNLEPVDVDMCEDAEGSEEHREALRVRLEGLRLSALATLRDQETALAKDVQAGCADLAESAATLLARIHVEVQALENLLDWLSGYENYDPENDGQQNSDLHLRAVSVDEGEQLLQTKIVSINEVMADIEGWIEALRSELTSLTEVNGATGVITEEEVRQLESDPTLEVVRVPGKIVASIKPPRKKKARLVACGDFLNRPKNRGSPTLDRRDLYSAGMDTLSLRTQLGVGALYGWDCGSLDVKTAFLTAPYQPGRSDAPGKRKVVVVRVPQAMIAAGLCPPKSWLRVFGALYGLQESPHSWSLDRDKKLKSVEWVGACGHTMKFLQTKSDVSMWLIWDTKEQQIKGSLGVYVDDLLFMACGPELKKAMQAVQNLWTCSAPEFASGEKGLKFCGLQIWKRDGCICVGQPDYINDLANRYPNLTPSPNLPDLRLDPEPETVEISDIRQGQKIVGELTWIANRSRMDIAFPVNRLSKLVLKYPRYVCEAGRQLIRYLLFTVDVVLQYGPNVPFPADFVEALVKRPSELDLCTFADASFGQQDGRSQSGVVITLNGSPLGWITLTQGFITLSTAESELVAAVDGMSFTQALKPLVDEMLGKVTTWFVYGDSVSCQSVLLYPAGAWRTRHLRLRCRYYHELIEEDLIRPHHIPGKFMPADVLTKPMMFPKLASLLEMVGVGGIPTLSKVTKSAPKKKGTPNQKVSDNPGSSSIAGPSSTAVRLLVFVSCVQSARASDESVSVAEDSWFLWLQSSLLLHRLIIGFLMVMVGVLGYLCSWYKGELRSARVRLLRALANEAQLEAHLETMQREDLDRPLPLVLRDNRPAEGEPESEVNSDVGEPDQEQEPTLNDPLSRLRVILFAAGGLVFRMIGPDAVQVMLLRELTRGMRFAVATAYDNTQVRVPAPLDDEPDSSWSYDSARGDFLLELAEIHARFRDEDDYNPDAVLEAFERYEANGGMMTAEVYEPLSPSELEALHEALRYWTQHGRRADPGGELVRYVDDVGIVGPPHMINEEVWRLEAEAFGYPIAQAVLSVVLRGYDFDLDQLSEETRHELHVLGYEHLFAPNRLQEPRAEFEGDDETVVRAALVLYHSGYGFDWEQFSERRQDMYHWFMGNWLQDLHEVD
ncbi:RE1 [Symbiodinium natans]|uniref:RE1 protein n=1 Tax=Symbiodinium natans TaxID=878477 RepID=A0A812ST83_9DINO|nr:RE1 [Symbiodinium natans]